MQALGCASALVVMVYFGLFLSTIWTLPLGVAARAGAVHLLVAVVRRGGDARAASVATPIRSRCSRGSPASTARCWRSEAVVLTAFMVAAAGDVLPSAAAQRLLTGDMAPRVLGRARGGGHRGPFALEAALWRPDAPAPASACWC
ncbi:MAG: hypothetical protein ACLSVD_18250 [Eggerthellaceae bacterium]